MPNPKQSQGSRRFSTNATAASAQHMPAPT